MIGASFDMSQSQASKWKKVLTPMLCETLKSLDVLPVRERQKVATVLERLGEKMCFQDATERLINRPKDDGTQKEFYRGKKSPYHKKNFIASQSQYVVHLSPTHEGTMHDKKIADNDGFVFPGGVQLFQDSGYQGFRPENVFIVQPFKKPKNGELNSMQKWFNKYVSSIRICIEHAIGGIKRCRIVKDKSRHFCQHFRDQVKNICVGLNNFRVTSPFRNYNSYFKWS